VLNFPSDRYLRAARRRADLSQRELAARAGVSQSCVARIEHAPQLAKVEHLAWLLGAVGLRLIVVDDDDTPVDPEDEIDAERRDRGRRRYPAHLDLRPGTEDWWADGWPMFMGLTPAYTFDRDRSERDWRRERGGNSAC
jgi:transcriptional regulator with XRE-family HTH domain